MERDEYQQPNSHGKNTFLSRIFGLQSDEVNPSLGSQEMSNFPIPDIERGSSLLHSSSSSQGDRDENDLRVPESDQGSSTEEEDIEDEEEVQAYIPVSYTHLVEDNCVLEIINGRHALYETFLNNYIPNSTMVDGGLFSNLSWFKNDKERIIIITGANASGKSVYLTQTGLIVYLAQIGCFVPAERAKIGIVDKILTRIRTQETMYKTQSSFALDSQQMAKSLSLATEKSLILIDEYGKGTDILDGPSLFGSIMVNMSKNEKCPRILACTHFHEGTSSHGKDLNNKGNMETS